MKLSVFGLHTVDVLSVCALYAYPLKNTTTVGWVAIVAPTSEVYRTAIKEFLHEKIKNYHNGEAFTGTMFILSRVCVPTDGVCI